MPEVRRSGAEKQDRQERDRPKVEDGRVIEDAAADASKPLTASLASATNATSAASVFVISASEWWLRPRVCAGSIDPVSTIGGNQSVFATDNRCHWC